MVGSGGWPGPSPGGKPEGRGPGPTRESDLNAVQQESRSFASATGVIAWCVARPAVAHWQPECVARPGPNIEWSESRRWPRPSDSDHSA